jgi:hypothetical protein
VYFLPPGALSPRCLFCDQDPVLHSSFRVEISRQSRCRVACSNSRSCSRTRVVCWGRGWESRNSPHAPANVSALCWSALRGLCSFSFSVLSKFSLSSLLINIIRSFFRGLQACLWTCPAHLSDLRYGAEAARSGSRSRLWSNNAGSLRCSEKILSVGTEHRFSRRAL